MRLWVVEDSEAGLHLHARCGSCAGRELAPVWRMFPVWWLSWLEICSFMCACVCGVWTTASGMTATGFVWGRGMIVDAFHVHARCCLQGSVPRVCVFSLLQTSHPLWLAGATCSGQLLLPGLRLSDRWE